MALARDVLFTRAFGLLCNPLRPTVGARAFGQSCTLLLDRLHLLKVCCNSLFAHSCAKFLGEKHLFNNAFPPDKHTFRVGRVHDHFENIAGPTC